MCDSPFIGQSRGCRFCGKQPVFRTSVYAMSLNMRAHRVLVFAALRRARPPASHSPVKSMQPRALKMPEKRCQVVASISPVFIRMAMRIT